MISVITGDIVNSRKVNSEIWLPAFKQILEQNKQVIRWEVYRGDSFQVEIAVADALNFVLWVKAFIKMRSEIDVRMAIGIGTQNYAGTKVSESNGNAYIWSGESLDLLKTEGFIIKTFDDTFDQLFNPVLKLLSYVCNQWKPKTAETIFTAIHNEYKLQKELAVLMRKNTSTISQSLKRGAYDEITAILNLYQTLIKQWKT